MTDEWTAPFIPAQVDVLNSYQDDGSNHPYTCGNNSRHVALMATVDGFECIDCDYTQNWALDPYAWLHHLRGEELEKFLMKSTWYAMEDDRIGGWCIMPVPLPPSFSYPVVGSFLSEYIARWMANVHNGLLRVDKTLEEHKIGKRP